VALKNVIMGASDTIVDAETLRLLTEEGS